MAEQDKFQQLKEKYVLVLSVVNKENIQLHNLHIQNDKLFIRGTAPGDDAKNKFWQAVRKVDNAFEKDFQAEIDVKPAAKPAPAAAVPAATVAAGTIAAAAVAAAAAPAPAAAKEQTYTVQSGDTLSHIAKRFYGNANQYMKIFNANKDQLKDPDHIKIGQVLKVPPGE